MQYLKFIGLTFKKIIISFNNIIEIQYVKDKRKINLGYLFFVISKFEPAECNLLLCSC